MLGLVWIWSGERGCWESGRLGQDGEVDDGACGGGGGEEAREDDVWGWGDKIRAWLGIAEAIVGEGKGSASSMCNMEKRFLWRTQRDQDLLIGLQ